MIVEHLVFKTRLYIFTKEVDRMENPTPKCPAADKNKWRAERRNQLNLPSYSVSEEIINAITHGVGALFAVAVLVILLAATPHNTKNIVSISIYGGTLFLLYTVSTLYHALGVTKAKMVFRILDHCTIFLLIAGTYTPITLLCLGGTLGWVMFFIVWAAAIAQLTNVHTWAQADMLLPVQAFNTVFCIIKQVLIFLCHNCQFSLYF